MQFLKHRIMYSKKIPVTLFLVFILGSVYAQFVNEYLTAADRYFSKGDYFSASQYYEKYLGLGKTKSGSLNYSPYAVSATSTKATPVVSASRQQVIYNLAESYRMLNYHEKAAPWYQQALAFEPSRFPLVRFHYATTLRALARYDEAEKEFTTFAAEYTQNDIYTESAAREIKNLRFIQQQLAKKDLAYYTVNKASGLNAEGATYAPSWLNGNSILFTSTRPEAGDKNKVYTNRVYRADYSNGAAGAVTKVDLPQPKDVHQGVTSVTPDGNTMFLSRWVIGQGTKTASIYRSKLSDGKWSEPVPVEEVNFPGFNSQQPFVRPDGKRLLFSSDNAGGQGGFDLWVAELDANGNASNVVNLGPGINTKFDDQAPFYHAESSTLVFSSNGRVGMGGFDFFYSKGTTPATMSEPVNFGYPVNSVKDDIYFISKGPARNILDNVLLSSDRDAACCLELFALHKTRPVRTISGTVVDCASNAALPGVSVNIVDTINNKVITEKVTDSTGTYSFTIDEFQPLKATATRTGYFTNSIRFNQPADEEAEILLNQPICLDLIPEKPITVENVYYDFNESSLKPESFPSLDNLVILLNENPTMSIELSAHTDSKGTDEYNLKLSDARAQSVVNYLITKGIDMNRLVAKGYGESQPVESNTNPDGTDNPQGREKNRRTEFKVLKN